MLKEKKINEFVKELSSSSPVPGGGGAAALVSGISSALTTMVFNLTVNKKSFNEYDDATKKQVKDALIQVNSLNEEFLKYVDKDADVFMGLMNAFRLPKTTEEQKQYRELRLQEGYKSSLSIPLELLHRAFEVYDYIDTACMYGNRNLISDVGIAAIMLSAAIESSIINIKANLCYITDKKYRHDVEVECRNILQDSMERKDNILIKVNFELR